MKKGILILLLFVQLLFSGCLTTYYSAKLPDTWKMQAGIGGSAYKLPSNDNYQHFGHFYTRMGLPFQTDIGINVFFSFIMPYAGGFSIRKQFNIIQTPSLDTKFHLEAEFAAGPVSGGYGFGGGFLINDFSIIGKLSRNSATDSWENGTPYVYNAITAIVSYDWKWKRLHLVPFFLFSAMGTIDNNLTIPINHEWRIDYPTKNYTIGITMYLDL